MSKKKDVMVGAIMYVTLYKNDTKKSISNIKFSIYCFFWLLFIYFFSINYISFILQFAGYQEIYRISLSIVVSVIMALIVYFAYKVNPIKHYKDVKRLIESLYESGFLK